jgi:two-component sensor histidine kinase
MTMVISSKAIMRIFAGSPDQVRHARDFVRRTLAGCPVADDAALLTSELVTNAIVHTASGSGGKFAVTIYRADRQVRVEVSDEGSALLPHPYPIGRAGESGFGLSLVDLVARRWGHDSESAGRVVWFELEW